MIRISYEIRWATPYDTLRYGEEEVPVEIKGLEVLTNGWITVDYEDGVKVHYPPQAFYYVVVRQEVLDDEPQPGL